MGWATRSRRGRKSGVPGAQFGANGTWRVSRERVDRFDVPFTARFHAGGELFSTRGEDAVVAGVVFQQADVVERFVTPGQLTRCGALVERDLEIEPPPRNEP